MDSDLKPQAVVSITLVDGQLAQERYEAFKRSLVSIAKGYRIEMRFEAKERADS